MFVTIMKSKIHNAVVTQADLYYEGSVTIDEELMEHLSGGTRPNRQSKQRGAPGNLYYCWRAWLASYRHEWPGSAKM